MEGSEVIVQESAVLGLMQETAVQMFTVALCADKSLFFLKMRG